VFGLGDEYNWALEGDDEVQYEEEQLKPEMRYQDVSAFSYAANRPSDSWICRFLNLPKFVTVC
jgi:hypothetical protein